MTSRMLVAGNWKMFGLGQDLAEVAAIAEQSRDFPAVDVALCVPATLIERAARAAPGFAIGGQDVHPAEQGAHTGCFSADMLKDAGAMLTLVGHSERREAQHEGNAEVQAKAAAALAAGLDVILCVGESLEEREAGRAIAVVSAQLDASLPQGDVAAFGAPGLSVAYEPIWAIGTGKVPGVDDIAEMHSALRQRLLVVFGDLGNEIRLLYGGSVKGSNAAEIFAVPNVDGALVGGASLKAADFMPIVSAAAAHS